MPDTLSRQLKRAAVDRKTTMRALIVEAVQQSLSAPTRGFRLRNASVGNPASSPVDARTVNEAIDSLREPNYRS